VEAEQDRRAAAPRLRLAREWEEKLYGGLGQG